MKINLQKLVFPLRPSTFGIIVYLIPIRRKVLFKYKSTCENTVSQMWFGSCSLRSSNGLPSVCGSSIKVTVGEVYWAGILSRKRESKCSWGLCSDNKKQRYERPLNRLTVNFRVRHTHSEKLALFSPARPQWISLNHVTRIFDPGATVDNSWIPY